MNSEDRVVATNQKKPEEGQVAAKSFDQLWSEAQKSIKKDLDELRSMDKVSQTTLLRRIS